MQGGKQGVLDWRINFDGRDIEKPDRLLTALGPLPRGITLALSIIGFDAVQGTVE